MSSNREASSRKFLGADVKEEPISDDEVQRGPQIGEAVGSGLAGKVGLMAKRAKQPNPRKRARKTPSTEDSEDDETTPAPKKRARKTSVADDGEDDGTSAVPKKRARKTSSAKNGEDDGTSPAPKKSRKETHKPSEKTLISQNISTDSRYFIKEIAGIQVPDNKFKKDGELKAKGLTKQAKKSFDEVGPMFEKYRNFHNDNVGSAVPCTELDLIDYAIRRCSEHPQAQVCIGIDRCPMKSYLADVVKKSASKLSIEFSKFDNTDDDQLNELCTKVLSVRQKTAEATSTEKLKKDVESCVSTVRRLRDQALKFIFRHPFLKTCSENLKSYILHFIAALYNDKVRMRVLYNIGISPQLLRDRKLGEAEVMDLLSLPIHKEYERGGDADKSAMQSGFQYGIMDTKFTFDETRVGEEEDEFWGEQEVEDGDKSAVAPNREQLSDDTDSSRSSSSSSSAGLSTIGEPDDEEQTSQSRKDGEVNNTGTPQHTRPSRKDDNSLARNGETDASGGTVSSTTQRPINDRSTSPGTLDQTENGEVLSRETCMSALKAVEPYRLTDEELEQWKTGKSVAGLPPVKILVTSSMMQENVLEIKDALRECYAMDSLSSTDQTQIAFSFFAGFVLSHIGEFREGKIVKFLRQYGYLHPSRAESPLPWPTVTSSDAASGEVDPNRDGAGAAPAGTDSTIIAETRQEEQDADKEISEVPAASTPSAQQLLENSVHENEKRADDYAVTDGEALEVPTSTVQHHTKTALRDLEQKMVDKSAGDGEAVESTNTSQGHEQRTAPVQDSEVVEAEAEDQHPLPMQDDEVAEEGKMTGAETNHDSSEAMPPLSTSTNASADPNHPNVDASIIMEEPVEKGGVSDAINKHNAEEVAAESDPVTTTNSDQTLTGIGEVLQQQQGGGVGEVQQEHETTVPPLRDMAKVRNTASDLTDKQNPSTPQIREVHEQTSTSFSLQDIQKGTWNLDQLREDEIVEDVGPEEAVASNGEVQPPEDTTGAPSVSTEDAHSVNS